MTGACCFTCLLPVTAHVGLHRDAVTDSYIAAGSDSITLHCKDSAGRTTQIITNVCFISSTSCRILAVWLNLQQFKLAANSRNQYLYETLYMAIS